MSCLGLLAGCGNTFRPVAAPIPQSGGDPGVLHHAIVLSNTGCSGTCGGNTLHLDVSGDSIANQVAVGQGPVYEALVSSQTHVMVVNRGDDTLTSYSTFSGPGVAVSSILLPTGSSPTFVQSRETNNAYVVEPGGGGVGNVGVVSLLSLQQSAAVPVGTAPVALTEIGDGSKVYVANSGSNNVSVISTGDHTVTTTIAVGSSPSWIDSSDETQTSSDAHACVYVSNNASGTVSVINPFNDTVASTVPVGAGPTKVRFDPGLRRVYVISATANSVTVLAHNPNCVSTVLKTVTTGRAPSAVTALADGTRFYVANSLDNTVSVFDAGSFALLKTIPVGTTPVSIDSSPGSSRVYTANQGSGNVSIIRTSDDTVVANTPVPNDPATCSSNCQQVPVQVMVTQ